jgi:hypothetical protein
VGGYLAGVAFLLIIVISVIYIKRRERLRLQQVRRVTDSDRPVRGTQVEEPSGTLTPFTLYLPFNTSSQLQTPRAEPSSTAFPHEQPHTRDQPDPNQPPRSADLRADSVGDTVVEMIQNMQSMQRQLLHLLGERDRDDHRLRRTSTDQSGEDPIETRSEGTSDSPPTYKQ